MREELKEAGMGHLEIHDVGPGEGAGAGEELEKNPAAPGVDHRGAINITLKARGQRLKRAHAHAGAMDSQGQPLGEGHPHPEAREGPRPNGDGDPVQISEGETGGGHDLARHESEALLVPTGHRLTHRGEDHVSLGDGGLAGV
jgi:hypothetical protein